MRTKAPAEGIVVHMCLIALLFAGWVLFGAPITADAQSYLWQTKTAMPGSRTAVMGGSVGGRFYVVNGASPLTPALQIYDSATNRWSDGPPPSLHRTTGVALAAGGRLYVLGGCPNADCNGTTDLVEVYDPLTNSWATLTPMPTARGGFAAAVIGGKIYVAGGYSSCDPCAPVGALDVYDVASDTWTTSSAGTWANPRINVVGAALNGYFFVAGGQAFVAPGNLPVAGSLDMFDPATETWTPKAAMPSPRAFFVMGVSNGQLLVTGGNSTPSGLGNVASTVSYDPAGDTWTTRDPIPTPRSQAAAGVIAGQLHVAGGINGSGAVNVLEVYGESILLVAGWDHGGGQKDVLAFDGVTGDFLQAFIPAGTLGLSDAHGLAFGRDRNLYVCDSNQYAILRYDGATGMAIDAFVPDLGAACGNIAFGPDGHLYVATTIGIQRYDGATGAFMGTFIPAGSGGLDGAESLAFGADGNLYVTSHFSNSVLRYAGNTGAFIDAFVSAGSGGLLLPNGLVFGPDGNLYVSSEGTNSVLRFSGSTGAFIDAFAAANSGGLTLPHGLAFGPDNNLYVVSRGTDTVVRYHGTSGAFIDVFASTPRSDPSYTYLVFTPLPYASNTALGEAVTVSFDTAEVTFSAVSEAGQTTIATTGTEAELPSGFVLVGTYYQITSTATFSGPVTVCLRYDATSLSDPAQLRLMHFESDQWVDVTTSNDTAGHVVCGQVTSLSPFAVALPIYSFAGFFAPVQNLPTLNGVKAGSSVPIKFSLGGNRGLNVLAIGYPKSQAIACDPTVLVLGVDEAMTAGSSGLSYDATIDQYVYVWKTDKAWANTCRQFVMRFKDGTIQRADFKFAK